MSTNAPEITTATGAEAVAEAVEPKREAFGSYETRELLKSLADSLDTINDAASEALKAGDRKGVLMTMRVGSTIERGIKSIGKALARANKVRKGADPLAEIDGDDDGDDDLDVD